MCPRSSKQDGNDDVGRWGANIALFCLCELGQALPSFVFLFFFSFVPLHSCSRTMLDVIIAIAALLAGVIAVNFLVSSATVGKASKDASQAASVAPKPKVKKAPKPSKKELAKRAQEEAELEALIARESKSTAGLTRDKQDVLTLDEVRERAAALNRKKEAPQGVVAASEFSLKQKVAEKAQGFVIVEEKKEETRRAPRRDPAEGGRVLVPKRQQLAQDLSQFFRGKLSKGRKDGAGFGGDEKPAAAEKDTSPAATGGRVDLKRNIARADPRGLWNGQRQWAAE